MQRNQCRLALGSNRRIDGRGHPDPRALINALTHDLGFDLKSMFVGLVRINEAPRGGWLKNGV